YGTAGDDYRPSRVWRRRRPGTGIPVRAIWKIGVKIMSNNIKGKVVVITGASSGLGEATARLLSAEGAAVVLGARRVERLKSLANELTGKGGKALAVATDVIDREQVKKLVDAAVQKFGRIDVMINNA